mmetsp:Transcript_88799/g.153814  ORF Transcript_88799/g.153814 Transcript_88799/m.153814 type:complete len:83 (-) Transcript_88799:255-503(-)
MPKRELQCKNGEGEREKPWQKQRRLSTSAKMSRFMSLASGTCVEFAVTKIVIFEVVNSITLRHTHHFTNVWSSWHKCWSVWS